MRRSILSAILFVMASMVAFGQSASPSDARRDNKDARQDARDNRADHRDLRQDRRDTRQDRRDTRNDRSELRQDRADMRRDMKDGNRTEAAKDRRDIRQDRAVLATVVEYSVHVDHVELVAGQNVPIADVPNMELNTCDVGEGPPRCPDGFVVDVEAIDFPVPELGLHLEQTTDRVTAAAADDRHPRTLGFHGLG